MWQGSSGSWAITVRGNLARRSDNGKINSSPVTTTTPIVRVQHGCTHTITIPVQDADQDVVRCRWAQGNECSDVCNALPGAMINQVSCNDLPSYPYTQSGAFYLTYVYRLTVFSLGVPPTQLGGMLWLFK